MVLKKTKEYEVRRYSPYLAAEVSMPSDAKPASGEGLSKSLLATYLVEIEGEELVKVSSKISSAAPAKAKACCMILATVCLCQLLASSSAHHTLLKCRDAWLGLSDCKSLYQHVCQRLTEGQRKL